MKAPEVIQTLMNAPLPFMLEKLGSSIANAQSALDANSIRLANEMASTKVAVGDEEYNLISLGFAPTFYAFTEASFEVKMEFSIAESEDWGVAGGINVGQKASNADKTKTQMFGVAVSAHYSRKFSMSVEASSSIAAKIVSLPAPDMYYEILKSSLNQDNN